MALVKDLAIGLSVNTAQFTGGMKAAGAAMARFGATAKQTQATVAGLNFKSATAGITTIRASFGGLKTMVATTAASLAASKVTGGVGDAVRAASELNEQVSKSQVVFGKSSDSVEARAKQMGDAFGYPRAQFIEGASSIGLIAKASGLAQGAAAKMGGDFAALAADAASFYNVPVEEALGAIRSGLVGEAEPMRRFGVLLNEAAVKSEAMRLGLAKAGAELTEGQKVQARSSLITRGLADAQGDLERTANSAANLGRAASGRWQNALTELGQAIQPVTDRFFALRESALKALTTELDSSAISIKAWAEQAAASGGLVSTTFDGVGSSIGMLADKLRLLEIGFVGIQFAIVKVGEVAAGAIPGIVKALSGQGGGMGGFLDKVVGGQKDNVFRDEFAARAADLRKQLADVMAKPLPSVAIAQRLAAMKAGAAPVAGAGAAKAAPVAIAAPANAKLDKGASDLATSLRTEIATFNMAGKAAEIYKLKLQGATKEQIALVESLDKQLQGKALMQEFMSPKAKLEVERNRLQGLFDAGTIDKSTFGKAMGAEREKLGMSTTPRFAGALSAGSAETYSAQLRFATRDTAKDEPMKKVEKNTETQVDLTKQLVQGINKLVERGVGKVGEAVAELFAF